MFRRLKTICLKFRSAGIIAGIKWLITTIYNRVIPRNQVIWFTDLTEIDSAGFLLPDHIEVKRYYSLNEIDKEDYKTLVECGTALMGSAGSILIRERLNKGAVLWLLKENGRLAGYRWTIAKDTLLQTYMPQTETDVHEFANEIFPGFRGRNFGQLTFQQTLIMLKNEGFKRYYAEIYKSNIRALKSTAKTVLKQIGVARRFNLLGRNVVIWYDMYNK